MNTTKYLIAAILVGTAAWNSTALVSATTGVSATMGQDTAEQSQAWLKAKSEFTPVNELRSTSDQAKGAATTDGTTMRLLGLGSGQDLTVFPPVTNKPVAPVTIKTVKTAAVAPVTIKTVETAATEITAQAPPQKATPDVEPQVVGMTFKPTEVFQQRTVWRQSEANQQPQRDTELVLLPSVESVGSSSTFLVSSQSKERIAFASRAFAVEEPLEQAIPDDAAAVQWGPDVLSSGCCSTGCQTCRRSPIIVVSTEAVFVTPDINGTPVSYRYDDFATPEILQFGPDFGDADLDNFYAAPRISLGWQGPCWGLVGRYYHLRAAENAFDPFVPTGQFAYHSFYTSNILEAYYTDLELTRNFCLHGIKSQFAFGARYALISHDESIYGRSAVDANNISILQGGARRNRQAHGTGLTMALNGRKPLFCNSCAHWFYNVRSSILWGTNQSSVESWADVTTGTGATVPSGSAGSIDTATAIVDDDLFIGEVQVGIEWDFALRCLPAKAFFRTAFEYQYWDGSTGLAASGSFAGVTTGGNTYQATTGSSAPGLIVDFVGLSIGTGFTW